MYLKRALTQLEEYVHFGLGQTPIKEMKIMKIKSSVDVVVSLKHNVINLFECFLNWGLTA